MRSACAHRFDVSPPSHLAWLTPQASLFVCVRMGLRSRLGMARPGPLHKEVPARMTLSQSYCRYIGTNVNILMLLVPAGVCASSFDPTTHTNQPTTKCTAPHCPGGSTIRPTLALIAFAFLTAKTYEWAAQASC